MSGGEGSAAGLLRGRVVAARGATVLVRCPRLAVGTEVRIERVDGTELGGRVVGFSGGELHCAAYGSVEGVHPGAPVTWEAEHRVEAGWASLCGAVLDGTGAELRGPGRGHRRIGLAGRVPPVPLSERVGLDVGVTTGHLVIDAFCPLLRGGRAVVAGPAGCGKSTLLREIACAGGFDALVFALVGERAREAAELVAWVDGSGLGPRSVVVVATAGEPAGLRMSAGLLGAMVAGLARASGARALLVFDSLSRFARACDEVSSLGSGEGRAGIASGASVGVSAGVAALAEVMESAGGVRSGGSVTGLYTALADGSAAADRVIEEAKSLADTHWVLDRGRASRGAWPAVDPVASLTRVRPEGEDAADLEATRALRSALAHHERHRDALELGLYTRGTDPWMDRVVEALPAIDALLHGGSGAAGAAGRAALRGLGSRLRRE